MWITAGLLFLAILVSGALYRIPRGGGLGEGRSFEGSLIWALCSAFMIWAIIDAVNWWMIPVITIMMMAGEAPGWSQHWPDKPTGSKWKLSLRGTLLLNPLMGPIYFYFWDVRSDLPIYNRFFDGWTGWSEIVSGLVTMTSYVILFSFYKEEYMYQWFFNPFMEYVYPHISWIIDIIVDFCSTINVF